MENLSSSSVDHNHLTTELSFGEKRREMKETYKFELLLTLSQKFLQVNSKLLKELIIAYLIQRAVKKKKKKKSEHHVPESVWVVEKPRARVRSHALAPQCPFITQISIARRCRARTTLSISLHNSLSACRKSNKTNHYYSYFFDGSCSPHSTASCTNEIAEHIWNLENLFSIYV